LDAAAVGVLSADVPAAAQPGRIFIAASGHEAQLVAGDVLLPACVSGAVPSRIECLPAIVDAADLPTGCGTADDVQLPVGLRFDDGRTCVVVVPDGEHVLVIGPPRSGRSTALQQLVSAWLDVHPDGWWRTIAPRRSALGQRNRHGSLADIIDDVPSDGRVLIAIDDAELVDDIGGALAALAASRRHGLTIIATGKPDSLRQSYGHWTTVIRRSRLGLVTTASSDLDGDLLGAMLPRRLPIAVRPGLAWLVSDGDATLAQVAMGRAEVDRANFDQADLTTSARGR
jgi:DNA segregation ATPase FtsK/SpoIIIE, S-DNA-T family